MYKQITLQDGNGVWVDTEDEIKKHDWWATNLGGNNEEVNRTGCDIPINQYKLRVIATISPYTLPDIPMLEERKLTASSYIQENSSTQASWPKMMEDYHNLRCSLMSSVSEKELWEIANKEAEKEENFPYNDFQSKDKNDPNGEHAGQGLRGAYSGGFVDGAKFIQSNGGYSEEQMKWVNLYERAPIGESGTIFPLLSGDLLQPDYFDELMVIDDGYRLGTETIKIPRTDKYLKNFFWLEQIKLPARTITEDDIKREWYWII